MDRRARPNNQERVEENTGAGSSSFRYDLTYRSGLPQTEGESSAHQEAGRESPEYEEAGRRSPEYEESEMQEATYESYRPSSLQEDRELIEANNWENSVRLIKAPDRASNCHGTTFADGQRHVSEVEVEEILQDDYERVNTQRHHVRANDVVIWRDNDYDTIEHSGYVSRTEPEIWVVSQWEAGGATYEHRLHAVPEEYGSDHEFYRMKR